MYLTSDSKKDPSPKNASQADLRELTAEELLSISVKNPETFRLLIDKFQPLFFKKAHYILKDENEATDVVQDTFIKIYLNAAKFSRKEGASFSSWGYKILLNGCFTVCKKKKRENNFFVRIDEELEELVPDQSVSNLYADTWKDELKVLISKLPVLLKRTFSPYILEGKSQKEIANEQGISEGLVRARIHRAKKKLSTIQKESEENTSRIDTQKIEPHLISNI